MSIRRTWILGLLLLNMALLALAAVYSPIAIRQAQQPPHPLPLSPGQAQPYSLHKVWEYTGAGDALDHLHSQRCSSLPVGRGWFIIYQEVND